MKLLIFSTNKQMSIIVVPNNTIVIESYVVFIRRKPIMEAFHRFFWTFNGMLAAFFGFRASFLLLFNKTEDIKVWTIVLIFCLFYMAISAYGYHMYIGFKFLSNKRQNRE